MKMKIDSKIIRTKYIWNYLTKCLDTFKVTRSEIANKMWITQPTVSAALLWTRPVSDDKFREIWLTIWLHNKDIDNLFKDADTQEFLYKHWEKSLNDLNTLEDIDFDLMLSREYWITDSDAIKDIKKYIEFIKNKK